MHVRERFFEYILSNQNLVMTEPAKILADFPRRWGGSCKDEIENDPLYIEWADNNLWLSLLRNNGDIRKRYYLGWCISSIDRDGIYFGADYDYNSDRMNELSLVSGSEPKAPVFLGDSDADSDDDFEEPIPMTLRRGCEEPTEVYNYLRRRPKSTGKTRLVRSPIVYRHCDTDSSTGWNYIPATWLSNVCHRLSVSLDAAYEVIKKDFVESRRVIMAADIERYAPFQDLLQSKICREDHYAASWQDNYPYENRPRRIVSMRPQVQMVSQQTAWL